MLKMTNKERAIFNQAFSVTENENCFELEQYTDGGVDMIITLLKDDDRFNSMTEQFEYYVKGFDVNEEIEVYMQDESYKEAFTYQDAVYDFEDWQEYIERVLDRLKSGYGLCKDR